MADIKIKHVIETEEGTEKMVGHLYQSMCKTMTRYEGEPKKDGSEAACMLCLDELIHVCNEMAKELDTYRLLFFPEATEDAPNK